MEKEKRLIDANALSEKIGKMKNEITYNRGGYQYCDEDEKNEWDKLDGFDSLVCDAPTVDAVEVVRCKDCNRSVLQDRFGLESRCCKLDGLQQWVEDNHFCSYGERRSDE